MERNSIPLIKKKKKLVVIYLHGTFGLREILSITRPLQSLKFIFSLRDAKKREVWKRFKDQRWNHNKNYFSCIMNEKRGLCFVKDDELLFREFSYDAAQALYFLRKYFRENEKNILNINNSQEEILDTDFYVYNWSGSPYFLDRKREAVFFYDAIQDISKKYNYEYIEPIFCLIGYSHGGNLLLDVPQQFVNSTALYIDFLILLGTPILDITKKNIHLKNNNGIFFFKHVINMYSPSDQIQVIDLTSPNKGYFFGINHNFGFSKRKLFTRKEQSKRKNVYNLNCQYLIYKEKELKEIFRFSEVQPAVLYLNHYNLAYFRNFYKKTVKKRKFNNFYFPPVLFLIPHIVSLVTNEVVYQDTEMNIFFQFLKNKMYLVEKQFDQCFIKGVCTLDYLHEHYLSLLDDKKRKG